MKNIARKKIYVAMSGGVDSSVAAALLKDQGYEVVGVFMKFWSPGENGDSPLGGTVPGYCLWKDERADAARVAAKLGIPLLTWDFTKEYEKKVVAYMLEAYRAGITPNPDIMCNKEIKFGIFFDRALAEGADYVATGHYCRISCGNPKSDLRQAQVALSESRMGEILNPKQIQKPNDKSKNISNLDHSNFDIVSDLDIRNSDLYHLLKAKDDNKDQSYFLYTLDQCHLQHTLFPIGEYTKPEVRELAKKYELPTAEKKDSQGVCFIGPLKMREFLKDYIKPEKGKVIHAGRRSPVAGRQSLNSVGRESFDKRQATNDQRILGEHDGAYYYTIGQRHGIDLKIGGGPYYVIGKDIENNIIYVGDEADLYSDTAIVSSVHWIGEAPELPTEVGVKIRYRSETVTAIVSGIKNKELRIKDEKTLLPNSYFLIRFSMPVRAIAPGQAAVFYDGERVLGGGVLIG